MDKSPKVAVTKAAVKPKVAVAEQAATKVKPVKTVKKVEPPKVIEVVEVPVKRPAKVSKPVKVKMVKDTFSMPAKDYALLTQLKKASQRTGLKVKKGELLRAGLRLLAKLEPDDLDQAIALIKKS